MRIQLHLLFLVFGIFGAELANAQVKKIRADYANQWSKTPAAIKSPNKKMPYHTVRADFSNQFVKDPAPAAQSPNKKKPYKTIRADYNNIYKPKP